MAINMYDQPVEAQFMQTYAPMPFEELMQAGLIQQNRWEEADMQTQEAQTSLGNIPSLEAVYTSSGERLDVGHRKQVEAKAAEFENSIANLVTNIPDKSSPEYRMEIRKVISQLRREFGPSGTFGSAAATVDAYKQFSETRTKEGIGHGNYHRGVMTDAQLRQFAESSGDRVSQFGVEPNFLAEINPHEVLQKSLDKVNDLILRHPALSVGEREMALQQIRKDGHVTGISPQRIYDIAVSLIRDNHELMTDVQARAATYGEDPMQLVDNYAKTMAAMYAKEDPTMSWTNMPESMFDGSGGPEASGDDMAFKSRLFHMENTDKVFKSIDKKYDKLIEGAKKAEDPIRMKFAWEDPSKPFASYAKSEQEAISARDKKFEQETATANANAQEFISENPLAQRLLEEYSGTYSNSEVLTMMKDFEKNAAKEITTGYQIPSDETRDLIIQDALGWRYGDFAIEKIRTKSSGKLRNPKRDNTGGKELLSKGSVSNIEVVPSTGNLEVAVMADGDHYNVIIPKDAVYVENKAVLDNLNTFLEGYYDTSSVMGESVVGGLKVYYNKKIENGRIKSDILVENPYWEPSMGENKRFIPGFTVEELNKEAMKAFSTGSSYRFNIPAHKLDAFNRK